MVKVDAIPTSYPAGEDSRGYTPQEVFYWSTPRDGHNAVSLGADKIVNYVVGI